MLLNANANKLIVSRKIFKDKHSSIAFLKNDNELQGNNINLKNSVYENNKLDIESNINEIVDDNKMENY